MMNQPAKSDFEVEQEQNQTSPQRDKPRRLSWEMIIAGCFVEAALIAGVWLRILFYRAFPDPFPTRDTWSYLTGVFGLIEHGQFALYAQRTPGFPLLVWLTLWLFKSFAGLNLIHGLLTLISVVAIGYVGWIFGGPWRLPTALIVAFLMLHPQVIYWEHFVMTEASFQAVLTLALAITASGLLKPKLLWALLAGLFTALAILIRPQGLFLTPLVVGALIWHARHLGRRRALLLAAAACLCPFLFLGSWSARNSVVNGFFGLTDIGPLQLFGVSARWIDLDRPAFAEDKQVIADSIRRYRSMPDDVIWVQYAPDGPAQILDQKYRGNTHRRDEVMEGLALEATLHHPFAFLYRGLSTSLRMITRKVVLGSADFDKNSEWEANWTELSKDFPVDRYRANLDQTKHPIEERESLFNSTLHPVLSWENIFVKISLLLTLIAFVALPWLKGPRRTATALSACTVLLLILTAGFLSEPNERYLSGIHGAAALAGLLAITGFLENLNRVKHKT